MGKKLYVGSLPYSVNEQQLVDLFAKYGSVSSAKIISDKYSGQSKGFGFVEMGSDEEAQKAITGLNGTQLDGRSLVVNEARPQEPRSGGGRPGGGGGGGGGRRGPQRSGGGGGGGGRW
jgi:RNA recognition motif-containing protein